MQNIQKTQIIRRIRDGSGNIYILSLLSDLSLSLSLWSSAFPSPPNALQKISSFRRLIEDYAEEKGEVKGIEKMLALRGEFLSRKDK